MVTGGDLSLSSVLGQAIAGPSSGGNVAISVGFWTGGAVPVHHDVYLPLIVKNLIHYAPPCRPDNGHCEDYDRPSQAYGPLEPGTSYFAYPDDDEDYYYIVLPRSASVTVQITNYYAEGQLMIYDENDLEHSIARDWHNAGGDGVMSIGPLNLDAGRYYIRIHTDIFNTTTLYILTVSD